MKRFIISALLLGSLLSNYALQAQSYAQQLDSAAHYLGQKKYCAATTAFQRAFTDSSQVGPFDLYAGANAAANCPSQQEQAMRWLLQLARQANVPVTSRDVDGMAHDAGLNSLHNLPQWAFFIASMHHLAARRAADARRAGEEWQQAARQLALPMPARGGSYEAAQPGFALYYAPVDTVRVPYLVFVPATYQPAKAATLIVYLHGGINNTPQFQAADPGVAQEPIFAAAASQNALVLYPFGRSSFGWLQQRAALDNVRAMVEQVKLRYHINGRRVYLGGMSNGGTAAYWYACQSPAGFAGFYALSALPVSALGPLNFGRLRRGAPLYALHAQDDQVVAYQDVQAMVAQHQPLARRWHFQSLPTGGHGFLYGPEGPAALSRLLEQLLDQ